MSFYDDDIAPYMFDVDACEDEKYEDYWITKDGKHIPYKKMKDSHLNNAINYLITNGQTDTHAYEKLKEEYYRRNKK